MKEHKDFQKKDVTNEEVLAFIEEAKQDAPFQNEDELKEAVDTVTGEVDKSELTEEEIRALENAPEPEPERDKVEAPVPPEFEQKGPSDMVDFMMHHEQLGDITVSDEEKDLYVKTLVNDVPFETTVTITGVDLDVVVRARSVSNDELVFSLVQEDYAEKRIIGVESGFVQLQKYLMCTQVCKIGDKDVRINIPSDTTFADKKKIVLDHFDKHYADIPLPKWRMLVNANMIFDRKQKICHDHMMDASFWQGAGTN